MSLKLLIALALGCAVATVPAAAQHRPNEARDMMKQLGGGGLSGKKLAKAIAKAELSPLGSKANPIRENMPQGQLAYLRRLRCPDGTAPAFFREGNVGTGIYRNIVDLYKVTCAGSAPVEVYMDMYHDGPELRPVPGFTMAPDGNTA
jgi:hypothetical protein